VKAQTTSAVSRIAAAFAREKYNITVLLFPGAALPASGGAAG